MGDTINMADDDAINSTTIIHTMSPSTPTDEYGLAHSVPTSIFVITILVLIILTTVIGNTLVCLSPLFSHRLRTATYTFLVSLAVADLLLGITVLPFSAIMAVSEKWPLSMFICNIYVSCDVMFCTSSILHLLVISFDRHYAITRPYAYQRKMNRKAALICIAIVWIISVLISFVPINFGWNVDQSVTNAEDCQFNATLLFSLLDGILLFFVPMAVMFVLYGRIVCIARRQAKAIRRLMINSTEVEDGARERTNRRSIDEHKATKIIAIVLGCFVICWVPYFTIFTFGLVFNRKPNPIVDTIVLWLGYVNSLVNPLVYTAMIRDFRNAFKRIISICFCSQRGSRCFWFGKNGSKSNFSTTYAHNSTHPETANGDNTCNKNMQFSLKPNGFYSKILRMSTSTVQVESQGV
ncbi:histamine H2 receptor-like [Apostichopus japonicus]|uniref:histamine H2 receptor-like n=1 Tax=Stichopus japonicus TaxID=307972 RepID=UPI003AB408F1